MEIEIFFFFFFTKKLQKLPPLPWLLHEKEVLINGNSSEKSKCLHRYSWEFKQPEELGNFLAKGMLKLKEPFSERNTEAERPSQSYRGPETGQKVISWHLTCALCSGLPSQYDVFIALNWHLSFEVLSVPGSHPSLWFSAQGPQAAAAPGNLSEIHILCPTPGLWNQKPQVAEASLNQPTRAFWCTEVGRIANERISLECMILAE